MNDSPSQDASTLDRRESDEKVVDIFAKYAMTPSRSKQEYSACELEKSTRNRAEWLHICFVNGTSLAMPFHHLDKMVMTSSQHLSLIYSGDVITLKGHHLDEIELQIRRGRLLAILCFNQDKHVRPPEPAVIITEILHQTIQEWHQT
ncbi:MAG: hypothetical protein R2867_02775 [Caldilineaceae bacterium]